MNINNTSSTNIQTIRFGFGYYGNMQSLKLRFKPELAALIIERIATGYHKDLIAMDTTNRKGQCFTYIVCMAPKASAVWYHLERAIALAKADALRNQADFIIDQHEIAMKYKQDMIAEQRRQILANDNDDLPF